MVALRVVSPFSVDLEDGKEEFYRVGDTFDRPADEAKILEDKGLVERVKAPKRDEGAK